MMDRTGLPPDSVLRITVKHLGDDGQPTRVDVVMREVICLRMVDLSEYFRAQARAAVDVCCKQPGAKRQRNAGESSCNNYNYELAVEVYGEEELAAMDAVVQWAHTGGIEGDGLAAPGHLQLYVLFRVADMLFARDSFKAALMMAWDALPDLSVADACKILIEQMSRRSAWAHPLFEVSTRRVQDALGALDTNEEECHTILRDLMGDALVVINCEERVNLFQRMPANMVEWWLCMPELVTDSEDTVAELLLMWVHEKLCDNTTKAWCQNNLGTLMRWLRMARLSSVYFTQAVQGMHWAPIQASCNSVLYITMKIAAYRGTDDQAYRDAIQQYGSTTDWFKPARPQSSFSPGDPSLRLNARDLPKFLSKGGHSLYQCPRMVVKAGTVLGISVKVGLNSRGCICFSVNLIAQPFPTSLVRYLGRMEINGHPVRPDPSLSFNGVHEEVSVRAPPGLQPTVAFWRHVLSSLPGGTEDGVTFTWRDAGVTL
jgi:hypothetical protein